MAVNKKYKIASDVAFRQISDGNVSIWKVGQMKHYFELDGIAVKVWTLLARPRDFAWLSNYLQKNHKLSKAVAEKNLKQLIKSLKTNKLVSELK